MSARRILMAAALCLFALPAWSQQKQGVVAQPMTVRPFVDLMSPIDAQQFVVGQTVVLDAVAQPYTGVTQETSVYLDGSVYATAQADEVTAYWTATLGTHTIYGKTRDEALSQVTPTITITVVANPPPLVSLTAPANGATYTVGATVPMTATASDSDSGIKRVEFWVDGAKAGEATSSPYAYNWTATVGDHSVYAKAIDNANGTASTTAITVHGQPAVPTLTVPGTSATGSYTASWTTSSGATHYELSEQVGGGSWTVIQDTSATSKAISGKTDGSYGYRVRACAGAGTGNCSAYSVTGTITVAIPPAVPALTVPATSITGSYTTSWTTSSGATHYELSEQVGGGSWTVIQDISATSKAISGKTDGSYGYRVRACSGAGTGNCSTYSATGTITVTIPPAVPTLTVPATSITGSYTASWTTSAGATHYELSEQVGGGSWTVIQDTSATSKAISGKTDGSYGYRVRACSGAGTGNCSTYSATGTITVTIPPAVPTLTVPASSSTGSYTTSWTTSSGATHYELSEQVGGGSWTVIQDTSATSKAISGKTDGSYGYRVRACSGAGTGNCSTYSATGTITVTIPPAVPTLTVPASSSTGSYTASWTTSSGATHYELSEQVGGGSWTVIQDTSATSKAISGKTDGSYGYRVRACSGAGTGNCSTYSATGTITVTIPPAVPTLTVPGTSITGSYTTSWTTSSGATHYELSEQVGGGSWTVIQDTSATSKAISGKTDGSYGYRVRACSGAGTGNCSTYSATSTITVTIPPAVPTLTVPGTSSTGSYTTSWTTSSGATHYELSEQVGGGSWSVVQDTSATSKAISGKTDGSYGYRVRACSGAGTGNCSTYSTTQTITVTIPPPPPAVPTLTVPGTNSTGSYTASWTTSSGATHYELSEQVGGGSWTVIQDISATSKAVSGKTDGSYGYRVRACAGSGTGNCSTYSTTQTTTVTIPPPPPAVPTLTVPGTNSTGSYTASWTTSSGATHYELGEQVGGGSWTVIQDASATSKTLSGKTSGSYGYRVRACVGTGTGNCSAYSTTGTVTVTIPPPPVTLTRTYTYNSYQELCRVEEPEAGTTLMGYDGAGNLAWSASGLASGTACSSTGNTTAINARKAARTYDVRNRVSTLTFPDANGNQSWTYTPDGLPDTVTTYNDGGATSVANTYAYNKRRLLTGETQASASNSWSVGYGYDTNGNLSTLVYPDDLTSSNRTVAYAPNALGQPTQAGTYATNVTYYPNGAIAGFTYGNGVVHTLTQNARGLPDRSKDLDGSTPIHDDSYDYDTVGNVLAISDAVSGNRGDRTMTYDDLNRLTQVTGNNAPSLMFGTASYSYDVLDNLTHVQVTAGAQARNQDYVYDAANRLTNVMAGGLSVIGLGYDVQGNLANRNGETYAFDYGNRMRTGGPETYRYDVQGRRIRSSSSAGVIYSLYAQSGQLLFQRDERSAKRRQYIYLGGSLVAESDMPLVGSTATVTYQHTDALGSPVATTNSGKTVLQRSEYEPYGYLLNRAMEDGPGYTGHVTDAATGLVYMQQRYMDPLIGQRFLSVDPVTAYSPGGAFNQYWYANANPYGMVDPDGRSPNEVYEASGGDFEGVYSVSATTQKKAPTQENCYETHTCTPEQADEAMRGDASRALRLIGSPLSIFADILNGNYRVAVLTAIFTAVPIGAEASLARTSVQGVSVLGHYPGYIRTAESIGARYFNVPTKIWDRMTPAQQWAANSRFLDRLASRGDAIVLSTPAGQAKAGSWFARELEYMASKGYTLNSAGTRLLPPIK